MSTCTTSMVSKSGLHMTFSLSLGLLFLDSDNEVIDDCRLGAISIVVDFVPSWKKIDHKETNLLLPSQEGALRGVAISWPYAL